MPTNDASPEAKLQKLGQRLRHAVASQHSAPEKDIQAALGAVREQWNQEQEVQRQKKPAPDLTKTQERERQEPEQDR